MNQMGRRKARRRKRGGSSRRSSFIRLPLGLWGIPLVRRSVIAVVLLVLTINLAVRFLGRSNPFPLSPYHLVDKSRALVALARHKTIGRPQPSPTQIRALLRRAAGQHRVPTSLALAVADVESGFAPIRISSAGAMGIMQLMPGTAGDLGVADPYDIRENIQGGVRYLARLSARYRGDVRRVAAAYNAGPGRVPLSGPLRVRRETSEYVAKVQTRFAFYRSLERLPPRRALQTTGSTRTASLSKE